MPDPAARLFLTRTVGRDAAIEAAADRHGGRVGLGGVLATLGSQARPSLVGRLLGRSVDRAYHWEPPDSRDPHWWPQGVSGSMDATDAPDERVAGRRLLVVSWYSHEHGSRVTVLDLDTLRYEHVLLVRADDDGSLSPVMTHAGGVVWRGDHLHVAATRRGLITFRLADVIAQRQHGHRFVLPAWCDHRPDASEALPMRYSFLSLDRSGSAPAVLAGEYTRSGPPARLVRFLVGDDGLPVLADDGRAAAYDERVCVRQMQGVAATGGALVASVSRGRWMPGSLVTLDAAAPRERRFAVPMGPEDLAWSPAASRLWTVTEHPRRRWICSLSTR